MNTDFSPIVPSPSGIHLLPGDRKAPQGKAQSMLAQADMDTGPKASRPLHTMAVRALDLSDTAGREQIENLLVKVCERLGFMPEMGRLKKGYGAPILDKTQEERVLADARIQADRYGLPVDLVLHLTQVQMDAAKILQEGVKKPENPISEADFKAAQEALRERISAKTAEVYTALKPLVNYLEFKSVQNEIARQLENSPPSDACKNKYVAELLKTAFQPQTILH
ncbi:chorismate mutase [Parendozoicomonas sp. Alg238-R29]|uniref:chorismate mutase n=1 Tax=Parendozoicomonas sp. Alg238-R29 TaxID=2993446 RepID=UPI00248EE790|nr:chorismate mutase [Parendozoicomonas sp. Alg238-R29]